MAIFGSLQFLKGIVAPRTTEGNVSHIEASQESQTSLLDKDDIEDEQFSDENSANVDFSSQVSVTADVSQEIASADISQVVAKDGISKVNTNRGSLRVNKSPREFVSEATNMSSSSTATSRLKRTSRREENIAVEQQLLNIETKKLALLQTPEDENSLFLRYCTMEKEEDLMQAMPYAVVRFIDEHNQSDDVVSEIPSKWLFQNNTLCYWPVVKNVSTYISKAVEPNKDTWTVNKVAVEFFCKSLHTARKKAEDSKYSSSEECTSAVKRKPKKHFFVEEWDCSDSDTSIRNKRKKNAVSPPPTFSYDLNNMPIIFEEVESSVTPVAEVSHSTIDSLQKEIVSSASSVQNSTAVSVDFCNSLSHRSTSSPALSLGSSFTLNDSQTINKIWNAVSEIKVQMMELHDKVLYRTSYDSGLDDSVAVLKQYLPVRDLER
ncbi:hypothetical protein RN001_011310 [Aquatica leii]|uniref:Uncharacterized protein n=1 Tax=Aquatica leii TaxID=1421715 RepID=A0AAN7SGL1_9COLE|nr:hypothetical protein RN001_011310 [Aquatica leii]